MNNYEKKYKEALERAKQWYDDSNITIGLKGNLEDIFPELKECEEESIRKELISFFKEITFCGDEYSSKFTNGNAKKWIAWLEKQDKHKCKEGFEYNGCIWQLNESVTIEHGKYYYCVQDFYSGGRKQASKGEVVQALRGMAIMGLDSKKAAEYFQPVNSIDSKWSKEDEYQFNTILHGLDLKRALYEKEGNQEEVERYKEQMAWLKSLKPQTKQKWSEDDEKMFVRIFYSPNFIKEEKDWLKSIKDRVQPNHWQPTEEQMEALDKVYKTHHADCECRHIILGLLNELKKL